MSDGNVRAGLVGFGAWGQHHANAIKVTEGVDLVAIAARSDSSTAAAKEAYPDADVYSDFNELIARDDLDFVDVVCAQSFAPCSSNGSAWFRESTCCWKNPWGFHWVNVTT